MSGPGLQLAPNDPRMPALRRVRPPAFLLLCLGCVDIIFWVVLASLQAMHVGPFVMPSDQPIAYTLNILAAFVTRGITIWAALNILHLRQWGIGVVGAFTLMLPLAPACCLGIPVGAYLLTVLYDSDVRKHFT